jgi:hypothetical protein
MKTRITRVWTDSFLLGDLSRRSATRPSAPFLRSFFTSTWPIARSQLAQRPLQQSGLLYFRYQRSALARRFRSLRFKSDKSPVQHVNPTPHLGSPEPALSLSQRLKKLSREYGWSAVGVYFALSLLDFPFCFLAVRLLGTERIGHYEDIVKHAFWSVVRLALPDAGKQSPEAVAADELAKATVREGGLTPSDVAKQSAADACKDLYAL